MVPKGITGIEEARKDNKDMIFYVKHIEFRLELPPSNFSVGVFKFLSKPAQCFTPHSILVITCFAILCEKLGISPTVTLFRAFFEFKSLGNRLYTFLSRPGLGILGGMPNREKGWMKKFLVSRWKEDGPLYE